ncbi:GNAT family N-acetyltransferase [Rahnella aquatilis]|uniref:Acetyltransferase n=1 Tax=Rahnella aquatilis (strain ATCC 33071 / DSM 4594 / JCM 1683 / NBRC 105701 / NCIMB 13365 / CIP 78.65) TaxID=745277 RepID=H2IZR5_RAHAC|nr:GNAT family N-acetyltransferase [Rahnella aquatilis]AEX51023.1 acetyltransferase [Rahnella aquatilis CIP 78.65 = ATCC 33071]KFD18192.1 putative acetyltransferase [Rahnella aquatilis CIP 78.65 = ATCC 33071]
MPSPLTVRPYEEADRPFLRTLYLASRKHTWTWLEDDFQLEDFDRAVIGETILVAERDGHLLGFASIFTQEDFLHNLFVDPQYQGTGAGSALLHAAEQTFTRQGSLKCLVKSEKSVAFYLSKGWNIISRGDSPKGEYYLFHSSKK